MNLVIKSPCPKTVSGPEVLFSASDLGISIVKSISLFSTNSGSPPDLSSKAILQTHFSM